MAKALKVVAIVAGVVAVVASGGAALGLGLAIGGAVISAATIATIASVVAAAASLGAQALTKPPPARGSIVQVMRDPNAPSPYVMGEGYFGGVMRHDVGYGATLKKIPNPYRFMPIVYSVAGPIDSISPRVDFLPVSSWYNGFLYTDTQLGASPESDALAPHWAGAPGWNSTSKLSGLAAIGWSFLFDKDGKRFASGLPLIGAYGKWVKVYDPRKDDTQPGGTGTHRLGVESTYEWSENPALHAPMYAYGRYQNGRRVMGVGMPADGIEWTNVMAWANLCDANGWTMYGVVYEGGANEAERRWANLRDICFAGGAEPVLGGKLRFKYAAPVVALDTITYEDLTDDDQSVMGMQPFRERINTVIPQYTSAAHNWEMVDAEPVINTVFLADDGEEKREVWPFSFVKNPAQAAQLAAYRLFDTREIAPITLVCKPRLRAYRPGECLHIDLPELGLDLDAVILNRALDPTTMKVTLELMGETPAKHSFCLGQVAAPPPTPALGSTAQERDELADAAAALTGIGTLKLSGSYTRGLAGLVTQAHNGAGTGTVSVTIPTHTRVYADGTENAVNGQVITVPESSQLLLVYDDPTFAAVDVTIVVINITLGDSSGDAYFSAENPARHYLVAVASVAEDGTGGTTGGSSPPGGGGWTDNPNYQVP